MTKLTPSQVREIRASKESKAALARRYRVLWSTIDAIVRKKSWRNIT